MDTLPLLKNTLPRCVWLMGLIAASALGAGVALAQDGERELLNSERIESKFGSYGIEVLDAAETLRISSLFSTESGQRTCRTFAVVMYPPSIDPAVAAEHAAVLAGGSIGAVFAANGWQVRKTHLRYGERGATMAIAERMRIAAGTPLAEHAYVLEVAKAGRVIEYAALLEIHHPAYLNVAELAVIYGAADLGTRAERVIVLQAMAAAWPQP